MNIYCGDLHGNINPIIEKITELERSEVAEPIYLIVLGDSGINYYLDERDQKLKVELQQAIKNSKKPIKIIFLRGNHDVHPWKIYTYEMSKKYGGEIFMETEYPDLIFLSDADVYRIGEINYIVFSGGYSRDWFQRILRDEYWSSDEAISDEEYEKILMLYRKKIDLSKRYCLLGHQMPLDFSPEKNINDNEMAIKTEVHLQEIYDRYEECISEVRCGHYHKNLYWKENGKNFYVHYALMKSY